jgi:hypothetical protein
LDEFDSSSIQRQPPPLASGRFTTSRWPVARSTNSDLGSSPINPIENSDPPLDTVCTPNGAGMMMFGKMRTTRATVLHLFPAKK